MAEKLLIIGATSVLAHETAKLFACKNASFVLIARNKDKLGIVAEDLRQRGAEKVVEIVMDVNDNHRYKCVLNQAVTALNGLDITFFAHAAVHDICACEYNLELVVQEIHTNFISTASLLMLVADYYEKQKRGTIAVITSIAGDRGRREQYLYGACKAALTVFLQGLRQRLHPANVAVVNLKPGLTETPLTAHLKKGLFFSKPDIVARGIYKAIKLRQEEVYVPWFWKYIMIVIRSIPEAIFKRIRFR